MKVLVVEDHSELAQNMLSYLSKEGYVCEVSEGFEQTMTKLGGFSYDLMVLDLNASGWKWIGNFKMV